MKIKSISVKGDEITVKFNAIKGANEYLVEISKKKDFSGNQVKQKKIKSSKNKFKYNLTESGLYYIRIRAEKYDSTKAIIYGKWSTARKVKVNK